MEQYRPTVRCVELEPAEGLLAQRRRLTGHDVVSPHRPRPRWQPSDDPPAALIRPQHILLTRPGQPPWAPVQSFEDAEVGGHPPEADPGVDRLPQPLQVV